MYCSNNNLLRDYFHTIVAVQGNYRKKPSQSYRSHERLLWPLPYPYCSLQSIHPKTNPLWPEIGINPHNFRPIVGTIIAFSKRHCVKYNKKRNGTQTALQNTAGLSLTLNLQSQKSPPFFVETIRLNFCTHNKKTTPDTGMFPLIIYICSPTQHNLVNRATPYYCRGTALSCARAVNILPVPCSYQIYNVYHTPGQRVASPGLGLASTEQYLHATSYLGKEHAASLNFSCCYPFSAVFLPIKLVFL